MWHLLFAFCAFLMAAGAPWVGIGIAAYFVAGYVVSGANFLLDLAMSVSNIRKSKVSFYRETNEKFVCTSNNRSHFNIYKFSDEPSEKLELLVIFWPIVLFLLMIEYAKDMRFFGKSEYQALINEIADNVIRKEINKNIKAKR